MKVNSYNIKDVYMRLGLPLASNVSAMTCPFCGHRNQKFGLSLIKNVYNCFHCKAKGNNFQLVKDYLELTDSETFQWFKNQFENIDSQRTETTPSISIDPPKESQDGKQYTDIYNRLFNALPAVKQSNYLVQKRCISLDVLRENNVRESRTEGFFQLTNFIQQEEAINAGIGYVNKSGKMVYMFWKCAYVMPLYDGEEIESIQGREAGEEGKYRFLKGIKIPTFHIPRTKLIEEQDTIYICEGILTAFAFLTDGLASMCITSKNFKIDEVLRKLEPYKNKQFILSPDLDGGDGLASMKKLSGLLREKGYNVANEFHNVMKLAHVENLDYLNTTDYADILKLRSKKNARK